MPFQLQFDFSHAPEALIERGGAYMAAFADTLAETGSDLYGCWPPEDAPELVALAETDDPDRLASRFAARAAQAGLDPPAGVTVAETIAVPDEFAGLSTDERAGAFLEMVFPRPRRLCRRCGARILPHYDGCPWDQKDWRRRASPSGGDDEGSGSPRDLKPAEPLSPPTRLHSEDPEERKLPVLTS